MVDGAMVECVPNFSEGARPETVAAIAAAVEGTSGVTLLDVTSDADHNRSVLTFAGAAAAVQRAAIASVAEACRFIDIRKHSGVHPRIGAADVIPFVPLNGATLDGCAELARGAGREIWNRFGIPVYLYGAAASRAECRKLEDVRRRAADLPPDFGHGRHPTAGACVVGARKFLIAWNINLRTRDLAAARRIAGLIRESNGGLPAVKALAFPLASRDQVQVSINLVDFEVTPLHHVFEAVLALCTEQGIAVDGSELIGMIPRAALEATEGHNLRWLNLRPELILENRLPPVHERG